MPLPMVHLAIAVRLADSFPAAGEPDFLLGSLAPDAIHMRAGARPADKDACHLRGVEGLPDLDRIRSLLAEGDRRSGPLADFTAGYAAHLIADRLWMVLVYSEFKRKLERLDPEAMRKLYYLETDQVDFDIYRRADWRPRVWEGLARVSAPEFSPLLGAGEIAAWRDHTLHWFDETMQEPGIVPQYLTDALTEDFVGQAAGSVSEFFSTLRRVDP
ncbi:MAG TPA: zinc dependent phospholipase C family protein [Anaerolineales bacterium]|nr:zinc dependent phospholipase C family protein [Anaerolineales bacterium]